MKKTFITKVVAAGLLLAGCAFTDYGNRVNDERTTLENLEHRREDWQSRYVIVLNGLERYPGDEKLEKERDAVRKKILDFDKDIADQRQMYESSVQDWERKITEDKLQKQIQDREERKNADKKDSD